VTFPSLQSFSSVEQGFESGMAYPIEPGHEGAIKNIYQAPPANPENYAYEQKLKKLRKLFYVDLPEQTGDTPPSLGQWLDERARAQRRIGTPGLPFWRDLSQIFIRYKYLLEKSGAFRRCGRRQRRGDDAAQPGGGRGPAAGARGSRAHRADHRRHVPRRIQDERRRPQDHGRIGTTRRASLP
jgi:hypothetical protein